MKPGPVACDFETYYDAEVSIKTLGVDAYLRHPKCDIYLVSIVGDDGEEFVGHPDDFDWDSLVGRELWSHNAAFDRRVYYYLRERSTDPLGRAYNTYSLPNLLTPLWNCTANLSVYNRAGRSLKAASSALLGVEITKDVRDAMKGKTSEMAKQSPPLNPGFANLYEEVCAYALSDSKTCRNLALEYGPSWPDLERALSDLTTVSCHRGMPVDTEYMEWGKSTLETRIWEIDKRLPWVTGIEGHMKGGMPALSPKGLAEACRVYGIPCPPSVAEDDDRCIAWEEKYGEEYPWVADMRDRRKANILLKRVETMLNREWEGWFPYGLKYGGAHTLRFSGDAGFNVQNFPKDKINLGTDEEPVEFDLRACVRAPEDYVFIIGDLSQIEARITRYLAGDEAMLQLIRDGYNIYEAHGMLTMPEVKFTKGKAKKEVPEMYALWKARELALGFGCGWQRFRDQAQLIYGVGLDWPAAKWKQQVKDYRTDNVCIPRLWNRLENDFRDSVGGNYELELPSNRVMTYFDVSSASRLIKVEREVKDLGSETAGLVNEKTRTAYRARTEIGGRFKWMYGGLLCENLVQATARDVFGEALVTLHQEGYAVIFHVHDEVTVMVHKSEAERAKKRIEEILTHTPDWLPGCPIGCEVGITEIYEK